MAAPVLQIALFSVAPANSGYLTLLCLGLLAAVAGIGRRFWHLGGAPQQRSGRRAGGRSRRAAGALLLITGLLASPESQLAPALLGIASLCTLLLLGSLSVRVAISCSKAVHVARHAAPDRARRRVALIATLLALLVIGGAATSLQQHAVPEALAAGARTQVDPPGAPACDGAGQVNLVCNGDFSDTTIYADSIGHWKSNPDACANESGAIYEGGGARLLGGRFPEFQPAECLNGRYSSFFDQRVPGYGTATNVKYSFSFDVTRTSFGDYPGPWHPLVFVDIFTAWGGPAYGIASCNSAPLGPGQSQHVSCPEVPAVQRGNEQVFWVRVRNHDNCFRAGCALIVDNLVITVTGNNLPSPQPSPSPTPTPSSIPACEETGRINLVCNGDFADTTLYADNAAHWQSNHAPCAGQSGAIYEEGGARLLGGIFPEFQPATCLNGLYSSYFDQRIKGYGTATNVKYSFSFDIRRTSFGTYGGPWNPQVNIDLYPGGGGDLIASCASDRLGPGQALHVYCADVPAFRRGDQQYLIARVSNYDNCSRNGCALIVDNVIITMTGDGVPFPSPSPSPLPSPSPSPSPSPPSNAQLHNCAPSTPWTMLAGLGTNVVCGNFVHQQTDLAIPGRGAALELTRTYNSADLADAGLGPADVGFGPGWSFNYGMSVTAEPGGTLLVRQPDGRRDRFADAGGGTYTPPPGIYDNLVKNGDGTYALTTPDQVVHRFDTAGRLVSITDRNNNTTTLAWATSGLANGTGGLTVTEPTLRKFVLSYGTGADSQRFVRLDEQGVLGRFVRYAYGAGDLTTVTDPRSNTVTMTYEAHRLKTITDQEQRAVVTTTFDGAGRVDTQKDGKNHLFDFDYSVPQKTKLTGPRQGVANTTTFTYDALYRVTGVRDPLDADTILEWDNGNNLKTTTDRFGGVTARVYDSRGNVTKVTDAAGKITEADYNARNDPNWIKDGNDHTTSFDYYPEGNLKKVTAPLNKTMTYVYQASGKGDLASATDQDGFATTYAEADQWGYVTGVTDPAGVTSTYTHDAAGRVTQVAAPLGIKVTYDYHSDTAVEAVVTVTQHPAEGQTLSTVTTHNRAGQPRLVVDARGQRTVTTYDGNGNVATVTVAENTAAHAIMAHTYDEADNLLTLEDANGRVITYEYDPLNRLKKVLAPDPGFGRARPITEYEYTDNQRQVTQKGPIAGRNIVTTYDPLGRVAAVAYPQGDAGSPAFTVGYEYDGVGNRKKLQHSLLGLTEYQYDALGRLLAVTSPRPGMSPVTVTYTYDQAYDLAGDPLDGKPICARLTYPASGIDQIARSVLACPDAAGRLKWVRDWNNNRTAYQYDDAGRLFRLHYPNNTRTTYDYDQANRLKRVQHERLASPSPPPGSKVGGNAPASDIPRATPTTRVAPRVGVPGTPSAVRGTPSAAGSAQPAPPPLTNVAVDLADPDLPVSAYTAGIITDHQYILDAVGNRLQAIEQTALPGGLTPATTAFEYDEQSRLKKVTYPGTTPTIHEYQYHPSGDRRFVTIDGQQQPEYLYDNAGRLRTTPGSTYAFDQAGYQRERTRNSGVIAEAFLYNGAGQLVNYQSDGVPVESVYDGDGLRLFHFPAPAAGGTATVWDVNRSLPTVLVEYAPGETTFTITGLGLIARVAVNATGEQYLYYHADALGSTRAITNAAAVTVEAYTYDAFGTVAATWTAPGADPHNAYRFTGAPYDGLAQSYYLRARHYDPATGRFTQPDPIGFAGGPNLYAYAANNPATLTDPTGLCPTCWLVFEIVASIYDAYDTGRTLLDPSESMGMKAFSAGMFAAGLVGPGGGYNSIAKRLVPYGTKGNKTSGILDTGTRQIDLVSGRDGPAALMPDDTPGMTKRMITRDHVEAHASAVMRQEGLATAVLYINKSPCPGILGCNAMLPHMLPEGATLQVHILEGGNWSTQIYRGLPDSAWPPPGFEHLVPKGR